MKKKNFYKRLNTLSKEAAAFIEAHMKNLQPKRVLHLFVPTKDDDTENKEGESLYDMPTFQSYDKHGGITYANITKLKIDKHGIIVCGKDKEGWGNADGVQAYLHELDPQDIVWLAEYLQ